VKLPPPRPCKVESAQCPLNRRGGEIASLEAASPVNELAVHRFFRQPHWAGLAGALALLLLVGVLDYATQHEAGLTLFYALPIMLAVWQCNARTAFLLALACSMIWTAIDIVTSPVPRSPMARSWDVAVRTGFFFAIGIAGAASRQQQRTAQARIELLERARYLERQVIEVSEYEQKRIGRDLHDGLCQYLAAVACTASTLQHQLEQRALPDLAKTAGELVQLVSNSVMETRNLSHGLMPVEIGHGGLGAALQQLADSTTRLVGVDCTFECESTELAHHDLHATHLVRIAQEATNNASRHGRATKIDILLTANQHAATLSVTDNGIGFSNAPRSPQGMGISMMRYRAHALGGELVMEDLYPHGTIVTCIAAAPERLAA
jgi:signal transduction histidine kinase